MLRNFHFQVGPAPGFAPVEGEIGGTEVGGLTAGHKESLSPRRKLSIRAFCLLLTRLSLLLFPFFVPFRWNYITNLFPFSQLYLFILLLFFLLRKFRGNSRKSLGSAESARTHSFPGILVLNVNAPLKNKSPPAKSVGGVISFPEGASFTPLQIIRFSGKILKTYFPLLYLDLGRLPALYKPANPFQGTSLGPTPIPRFCVSFVDRIILIARY